MDELTLSKTLKCILKYQRAVSNIHIFNHIVQCYREVFGSVIQSRYGCRLCVKQILNAHRPLKCSAPLMSIELNRSGPALWMLRNSQQYILSLLTSF